MNLTMEISDVLRDCAERFDKIGVPYMLTGSMALTHYAQPRTTVDIDIVIEISSNHADKIIKEFEPDYYVPRNAIYQAISRKSIFNLIHQESLFKIDCVIRKNEEFQNNAFQNRKKVGYTDFEVWIISKEDLILSKLNWARTSKSEMQFRDVENLLRGTVREDYLQEWAQKLDLTDDLNKIYERIK